MHKVNSTKRSGKENIMVLPVTVPRTPSFPGVLDTLASLTGYSVGPITELELRLPDTPLFGGPHPIKLKSTQSPSSTVLCCPRHVVPPHPATVLPLSLSLLSFTQRERERRLRPWRSRAQITTTSDRWTVEISGTTCRRRPGWLLAIRRLLTD